MSSKQKEIYKILQKYFQYKEDAKALVKELDTSEKQDKFLKYLYLNSINLTKESIIKEHQILAKKNQKIKELKTVFLTFGIFFLAGFLIMTIVYVSLVSKTGFNWINARATIAQVQRVETCYVDDSYKSCNPLVKYEISDVEYKSRYVGTDNNVNYSGIYYVNQKLLIFYDKANPSSIIDINFLLYCLIPSFICFIGFLILKIKESNKKVIV